MSSVRSKSGAKATRSPDASRDPTSTNRAERLECGAFTADCLLHQGSNLVGKSQRDFIIQPSVGRQSRPTLGGRTERNTTRNGLKSLNTPLSNLNPVCHRHHLDGRGDHRDCDSPNAPAERRLTSAGEQTSRERRTPRTSARGATYL